MDDRAHHPNRRVDRARYDAEHYIAQPNAWKEDLSDDDWNAYLDARDEDR
jgi:hypothetical protein